VDLSAIDVRNKEGLREEIQTNLCVNLLIKNVSTVKICSSFKDADVSRCWFASPPQQLRENYSLSKLKNSWMPLHAAFVR